MLLSLRRGEVVEDREVLTRLLRDAWLRLHALKARLVLHQVRRGNRSSFDGIIDTLSLEATTLLLIGGRDDFGGRNNLPTPGSFTWESRSWRDTHSLSRELHEGRSISCREGMR